MYILEKHGGRLPLKIKAIPEGTTVPYKNGKSTTHVWCHVFSDGNGLLIPYRERFLLVEIFFVYPWPNSSQNLKFNFVCYSCQIMPMQLTYCQNCLLHCMVTHLKVDEPFSIIVVVGLLPTDLWISYSKIWQNTGYIYYPPRVTR